MKNLTVLVTTRLSKETKKKPARSCNPLLRKNATIHTVRSERNGWNAKSWLWLGHMSMFLKINNAEIKKAWEWLKDNAKWAFVAKVGEDSPPPSLKRTKTSSSNAYKSSSDPQYPPGFSPQQQQQLFSVEDSPPQRKRKGKKATSTSSTKNEMFDLVKQIVGIKTATETEAEQRQRYREQKLCILEANEERKAQLLDREIENQDMEYFLWSHDHLTGGILRMVVERKRQIATKYGWELENP
ncbi:unnamed protein product [Lactuca saligna]|uniref:No apical meristem-associated C-terminal domain-containing protein n=1 Tax=Lactuca saligna TaxID=75948 RepID=A0AA36EB17_LACSI|nr:unnamed protein product [Lactuca saligna]